MLINLLVMIMAIFSFTVESFGGCTPRYVIVSDSTHSGYVHNLVPFMNKIANKYVKIVDQSYAGHVLYFWSKDYNHPVYDNYLDTIKSLKECPNSYLEISLGVGDANIKNLKAAEQLIDRIRFIKNQVPDANILLFEPIITHIDDINNKIVNIYEEAGRALNMPVFSSSKEMSKHLNDEVFFADKLHPTNYGLQYDYKIKLKKAFDIDVDLSEPQMWIETNNTLVQNELSSNLHVIRFDSSEDGIYEFEIIGENEVQIELAINKNFKNYSMEVEGEFSHYNPKLDVTYLNTKNFNVQSAKAQLSNNYRTTLKIKSDTKDFHKAIVLRVLRN